MDQLIEIKTVPISIEFKVTDATLKPANATAQLELKTEEGGLHIKSSPIKLNVDSYEADKSICPSLKDNIDTFAANGKQAAFDATARYAQEGSILLNVHFNKDAFKQVADLRLGNNEIPPVPNIRWIPDKPVNISWEPGDMTIKYETDKLNFDFKQNQQPLEFTPGNIEFIIKQMPDVIITYVGGPIYVPPSADPDYINTEA